MFLKKYNNMAIFNEMINGDEISVNIKSSNLLSALYNTTNKTLILEFNTKTKYEYKDVPWEIFTKFRMAQSQGQYFNKNIQKSYIYKKLE